MREKMGQPIVRTTAIIFLCFLLTSTGWLAWEYHLLDLIAAQTSDVLTMIVGYLLQAAGIGVFAFLSYRKRKTESQERLHRMESLAAGRKTEFEDRLLLTALIAHMVFMIPAVLSHFLIWTIVFGLLMNIACGLIAGYYFYDLAKNIEENRKATSFGIGYGAAILASWLLSLSGNAVYYSEYVLIICAVLTAITGFVTIRRRDRNNTAEISSGPESKINETEKAASRAAKTAEGSFDASTGKGAVSTFLSADSILKDQKKLLLLLCGLVFLFSVVNGSGFAFPSADLSASVNVELSRLIYAAGLILAGFITDKNRKYGAVCALVALIIPFIILALRGEIFSSIFFWVLSYFAFGFFAVYRIVLFSDLATKKGALFLAGFGLMIGRIGDAVGEAICIMLGGNTRVLVLVTAILFAVTVLIFFKAYSVLYTPKAEEKQSEQEKFYQFAVAHELSSRERDLLQLLLEEKTNSEIAAALFISENTVKFHVKNILQKTGCKNRKELIAVYYGMEGTSKTAYPKTTP